MNWDDYRLILALAREKTVRGAAKSLGVSHATVSRRLAHLNGRPSGPFLQKSPSGLWPSPSGQAVVQAAEAMERIVDESTRRQRASGTAMEGCLRLSVPDIVLQYLLIEAIEEFRHCYPEIDLSLDTTDELVDLDRAAADLVIRGSDSPPDHWIGRRLFPYMLSLYVSRDYFERTAPSDYAWIAPPAMATRWRDWLEESPYPEAPIAVRISGIAGRFAALRRGLGIGRAACFMADREPDLMRLPGAPLVAAETLWVLAHPDFAGNTRVRTAMRFFADRLRMQRELIQGTA